VDIMTTMYVNSEATLRAALISVAEGSGPSEIQIGNLSDGSVTPVTITLTQDLPVVARDLTIHGNGSIINGADQFRGLLVHGETVGDGSTIGITVDITDLNFDHTVARGGNGGNASLEAGPGGGGAGLGGGLFVGEKATVTIENVNFSHTAAIGGNGGVMVIPTSGASIGISFGRVTL
jgi:hypothetical protein